MNKDIEYYFKNASYISFKDISLGIMIGSIKDLVRGTAGRVWFIETNLLFIHIKLGIIRSGFKVKRGEDK
jgi:hypothetical protein